MENEIINVEETVLDGVEIAPAEDSGKGMLVAAAIGGVAVLAGIAVWKKVIKPLVAKAKAKKEAKQEVIEGECTAVTDENESEGNN